MLDFALVKEALHERGLILSVLAPHLARPVPFLYPLTKRFLERPYVGSASPSTTPCPSPVATAAASRSAATRAAGARRGRRPARKIDAFVGSIRYYDQARSTTRSTSPTSCGRRPTTARTP